MTPPPTFNQQTRNRVPAGQYGPSAVFAEFAEAGQLPGAEPVGFEQFFRIDGDFGGAGGGVKAQHDGVGKRPGL